MISEKTFCTQYSTFWRETLPNLEPVIRGINLGYERLWSPIDTDSDANRRDFVSEIGYRLSFQLGQLDSSKIEEKIDQIARSVFSDIPLQTNERWNDGYYLTNAEAREVERLAFLILRYMTQIAPLSNDFTRPAYSGHGILGSCYGDFEKPGTLVEMKYVSRNFRGTDVRQLLTYSALRYYETGEDYGRLFLFNPLLGVHFETNASDVLSGAAGITPVEFYSRMSYILSSGEVSH